MTETDIGCYIVCCRQREIDTMVPPTLSNVSASYVTDATGAAEAMKLLYESKIEIR